VTFQVSELRQTIRARNQPTVCRRKDIVMVGEEYAACAKTKIVDPRPFWMVRALPSYEIE